MTAKLTLTRLRFSSPLYRPEVLAFQYQGRFRCGIKPTPIRLTEVTAFRSLVSVFSFVKPIPSLIDSQLLPHSPFHIFFFFSHFYFYFYFDFDFDFFLS